MHDFSGPEWFITPVQIFLKNSIQLLRILNANIIQSLVQIFQSFFSREAICQRDFSFLS